MAKNEDVGVVMSAAEMKPLLLLSKRQAVGCALALTKDKQGVILLDKRVRGRKLGAMLKAAAAGAKLDLDMGSMRFGHANVGEDDGTVHFAVNKEAPSALRPKLLEQLKKAGFGKCEITVDASLDAEDGAAPQAGAPAAAPAVAGPGGASSAAPADAAALTARLTGLVKRLAGAAQAPGADAMATAARAAQAAIKSGDFATASVEMNTLERLLGSTAPAQPSLGSHPAAATFAKAGATWTATRKRVEAEVEKLLGAMSKHYEGHDVAPKVPEALQAKVAPVLAQFDHTLSAKLEQVAKNTDPAAHSGMVADVQRTIEQYKAALAANATLEQLDANPFVPLQIRATLTTSLGALSKAVGTQAAAGPAPAP